MIMCVRRVEEGAALLVTWKEASVLLHLPYCCSSAVLCCSSFMVQKLVCNAHYVSPSHQISICRFTFFVSNTGVASAGPSDPQTYAKILQSFK